MITKLTLNGFKSYRKLEFEPGGLNVLIGPNGSGKTNLLKFFEMLHSSVTTGLVQWVNKEGGMEDILWWGGSTRFDFDLKFDKSCFWEEGSAAFSASIDNNKSNPVIAEETLESEAERFVSERGSVRIHESIVEYEYGGLTDNKVYHDYLENEFVISQLKDRQRYPTLYNINEYFSSFRFYYDFDTSLDAEIRNPVRVNPLEKRLSSDGGNLTNIINLMKTDRNYYESYQELVDVVKLAYPTFEDFIFPATAEGKIILAWRDANIPKDLTASKLSDGTLRFLCLCAILLNPEPSPLICIDEPEVNLHPKLVGLIAGLMEKATANSQIIVATHSPEFVTSIRDPKRIVVVDTKYDGDCYETTLRRSSDRKNIDGWLKDGYSLGDLWLDEEI